MSYKIIKNFIFMRCCSINSKNYQEHRPDLPSKTPLWEKMITRFNGIFTLSNTCCCKAYTLFFANSCGLDKPHELTTETSHFKIIIHGQEATFSAELSWSNQQKEFTEYVHFCLPSKTYHHLCACLTLQIAFYSEKKPNIFQPKNHWVPPETGNSILLY